MDKETNTPKTKPSEIICLISFILMLISFFMVSPKVLVISTVLFVSSLYRILFRTIFSDDDVSISDSYIHGGSGTGFF